MIFGTGRGGRFDLVGRRFLLPTVRKGSHMNVVARFALLAIAATLAHAVLMVEDTGAKPASHAQHGLTEIANHPLVVDNDSQDFECSEHNPVSVNSPVRSNLDSVLGEWQNQDRTYCDQSHIAHSPPFSPAMSRALLQVYRI